MSNLTDNHHQLSDFLAGFVMADILCRRWKMIDVLTIATWCGAIMAILGLVSYLVKPIMTTLSTIQLGHRITTAKYYRESLI